MKYRIWAEFWLKNYIEPLRKVTTWRCYENEIRLHICPYLEDYDIEKIDSKNIQQIITDLLNGKSGRKALSNSHVNLIITIIKESISCYFSTKTRKFKKEFYIKRPSQIQKEIKALSLEEEKTIINYILKNKKIKYYGFIISFLTGLRLGELLALNWDDIDFEKKFININKTRTTKRDKNGIYRDIISIPKSKFSIRKIPLTDFLICLLKELKNNSVGPFVISHKGRYQCIRSYQKMFKDLLKRLSIEDNCFYCTRHSFATRLLENGINPKIPSEIMGHSNTYTTFKHYNTCFMEDKRAKLELLSNKLLNSDKSN